MQLPITYHALLERRVLLLQALERLGTSLDALLIHAICALESTFEFHKGGTCLVEQSEVLADAVVLSLEGWSCICLGHGLHAVVYTH